LQANEIRATVDLTDIAPGKELRRRVEVSMPFNVTLVGVEPPRVTVVLPPPKNKTP